MEFMQLEEAAELASEIKNSFFQSEAAGELIGELFKWFFAGFCGGVFLGGFAIVINRVTHIFEHFK